MLEIRNLTKVYRPKRGVPVTALDHISLRLPATGMVFLLGKSGSGKSTLLNLLGGLDKYDEGEIRIKDVSSRNFRQQHFDSYRNTYVGFIFQEYNILEEFTVGANIALAIELQGKKATDSQINDILREVDLDGYGNRRPNELSGGQKQRVAIARALVKQPRIIMADEPTGALDSHTGRQIFDTLKKLSAQRLVLVVSHDREFAEQYADRIIELADGRVVSDLTYTADDSEPLAVDTPLRYEGTQVTVAPGYHLTEEDRVAINAYIDTLRGGLSLQLTQRAIGKQAVPTDNDAIAMETGGFQPIKSRLPLRSAFKIGASSLKHKRIRLVVTILLSCIAFGLFGLSDTFGAYNHIRTCTDSLLDSGVGYAAVEELRLHTQGVGENAYSYYSDGYLISDNELTAIVEKSGVPMQGVYLPRGKRLGIDEHLADTKKLEGERVHTAYTFNGFAEMTDSALADWGYTLVAGRLPAADKMEIAIPQYMAELFVKTGYADAQGQVVNIAAPSDMVGKTLYLAGADHLITGVVDTHLDLSRYAILNEQRNNPSTAEELVFFALQTELSYVQRYSLHTAAFVGPGYVATRVAAAYPVRSLSYKFLMFNDKEYNTVLDPYAIGTLEDIRDTQVTWLDGKPRTQLGDKELVVSLDLLERYGDIAYDNQTAEEITQQVTAVLARSGPLREESQRVWDSQRDAADQAEALAPYEGYTVVGYLDPSTIDKGLSSVLITSPAMKAAFVIPDEGTYQFAIGKMPTEEKAVKQLVSYCYSEGDVRYELRNAVTYELDTIHEVLAVLAQVFLYVGIGFALFAALMLTNFISTSIAYKKQEIGILRAIGSRSNDVFRIFFSEAFLIAMINFLLASTGVGAATAIINHVIRSRLNVLVTVLHFGPRQIVLLLAVSLLVAAVASFFPVRHIAAKRPIDAIRNR